MMPGNNAILDRRVLLLLLFKGRFELNSPLPKKTQGQCHCDVDGKQGRNSVNMFY